MTKNEDRAAKVADPELREQLAACYDDWDAVCAALGFDGHADPQEVLAEITQRPKTQATVLTVEVKLGDIVDRIEGDGKVLVEVMAERERQDAQWGGPEHDDTRAAHDWQNFIQYQLDKERLFPGGFRGTMMKVAALAVAAIQSYDRETGRG